MRSGCWKPFVRREGAINWAQIATGLTVAMDSGTNTNRINPIKDHLETTK